MMGYILDLIHILDLNRGKHFEVTIPSRDITLPTKVRRVKAMVFPVVMYGYESWTVKKAECQRIDAFELWCWRRLLRVPWTARRSNQSMLSQPFILSKQIKQNSLQFAIKGSLG